MSRTHHHHKRVRRGVPPPKATHATKNYDWRIADTRDPVPEILANRAADFKVAIRQGKIEAGHAFIDEFKVGWIYIRAPRSREVTEMIRRIRFDFGPEE